MLYVCTLKHNFILLASQGGGDEVDGDVQPPVDISRPNIPSVLIVSYCTCIIM